MIAVLAVQVAEKAGESVTNPVIPTLNEMLWGAISFFALWILMRYVCLPPLMRVRAQRDAQVQADREAAAAAEEQAEQVRRDYDATLGEARSEASRIIEEARAAAEHERGQVVQAAESEVAAERQTAMAELDVARSAALEQIKGDVADLAVSAASKVVQSDLDVSANRATVDDYVNRAGGQR
jgi:F-type H+-transporting ATPase subunit b